MRARKKREPTGAHPQTIVYGVHHDLERDVVVMESIGLVVGLPPAVYRGV